MTKRPVTETLQRTLERFYRRTTQGIKPGLDVIAALLEQAGQPQQSCPYIHVAGTNGKGSVCALIASVLQQAGYRTGLYTSPHLRDFNERIQVDGQPLPDDDLVRLIDQIEQDSDVVEQATGLRRATFFECATAMAWRYFHQKQVDWAVLETGMGGRWDATNVGTPALALITPVAIDHVDYLGRELRGIAAEKAGIIKAGVPVVCGRQDPVVAEVVSARAREVGAPLCWAEDLVQLERLAQDWHGQKIRVTTSSGPYRPLTLALLGRHQLQNAALALAALDVLQAHGRLVFSEQALRAGWAQCRWPARLQVCSTDPLVILDVAHNPHGARALMAALEELLGDRPLAMVVGFLRDKDVVGCVQRFARRAERFWSVPTAGERGCSAEDVARLVATTGKPVVACDWPTAEAAARKWAAETGGAVCIAGSLYLAGAVLP